MNELKNFAADWAIILGSGLSFELPGDCKGAINYSDIKTLPPISVEGHQGKVLPIVLSNGLKILAFFGRFHLYEGRSVQEVQSIVDLIADCKIKNLLITNAAGGINSDLQVTDLMLIDSIGQFQFGERGLLNSLTESQLIVSTSLTKSLGYLNNHLKTGTYCAVLGPSYETLSEINLFRQLGFSAIGMSTYLEVKRALELNLNVAALSVITNSWAEQAEPTHQEVLDNAKYAQERLNKLLFELLGI